jgi:leucyl-tRNA synthetase
MLWDTIGNAVVNTDLVDHKTIFPELNTMPGWAGSSLLMRYMDPHNEKEFAGKEALAKG